MINSAFKLLIIGDRTANKTHILNMFTDRNNLASYQPIVFDNQSVEILIDQHVYHLTLQDTTGEENYQALRTLSYHSSVDIIFIAYSAKEQKSFRHAIDMWLPEARKFTNLSNPSIFFIETDATNADEVQHREISDLGFICFQSNIDKQQLQSCFEIAIKHHVQNRAPKIEIIKEDQFCCSIF